ncbi:hypothetical protein B4064_3081 [Caldibacillus thermoamylovorans]|nr:hypothetical protein B4166_3513 [Caldibacillus thermoamylovorans]KIO63863.1 hypothetical protein B4064_3081 [Caldibacillus thermoamylovorans]KIO66415.1 hypothetical protein B4065_2296 [Caldibacillus thermoamylovorans]
MKITVLKDKNIKKYRFSLAENRFFIKMEFKIVIFTFNENISE